MALDALHDLCLGKAATNHLFKAMTDAELRAHYGRQEAEASLSSGVAGIKFLLLRTRETSPTISPIDSIKPIRCGASGGGLMENYRVLISSIWRWSISGMRSAELVCAWILVIKKWPEGGPAWAKSRGG